MLAGLGGGNKGGAPEGTNLELLGNLVFVCVTVRRVIFSVLELSTLRLPTPAYADGYIR